jgi:hypothetical protein
MMRARAADTPTAEENMSNSQPFAAIPSDLVVRLRIVPHREQRYDTEGDWLWEGSQLEVRISREVEEEDPRYALIMFVHEMIEAFLCSSAGISAEAVDVFDMSYAGEGEPGEDPAAPYHRQHLAAEAAERALARKLGVNWKRYLGK